MLRDKSVRRNNQRALRRTLSYGEKGPGYFMERHLYKVLQSRILPNIALNRSVVIMQFYFSAFTAARG
ncbi:hypothetical protein [Methylomonas albis]|nr:hypothetical protein [Methylomonas albis]